MKSRHPTQVLWPSAPLVFASYNPNIFPSSRASPSSTASPSGGTIYQSNQCHPDAPGLRSRAPHPALHRSPRSPLGGARTPTGAAPSSRSSKAEATTPRNPDAALLGRREGEKRRGLAMVGDRPALGLKKKGSSMAEHLGQQVAPLVLDREGFHAQTRPACARHSLEEHWYWFRLIHWCWFNICRDRRIWIYQGFKKITPQYTPCPHRLCSSSMQNKRMKLSSLCPPPPSHCVPPLL